MPRTGFGPVSSSLTTWLVRPRRDGRVLFFLPLSAPVASMNRRGGLCSSAGKRSVRQACCRHGTRSRKPLRSHGHGPADGAHGLCRPVCWFVCWLLQNREEGVDRAQVLLTSLHLLLQAGGPLLPDIWQPRPCRGRQAFRKATLLTPAWPGPSFVPPPEGRDCRGGQGPCSGQVGFSGDGDRLPT